MSETNKNSGEARQLSLASKIGFLFIIMLLAGGGVYLGFHLSGQDPFTEEKGARFEDLDKDIQERIGGLAAAVKQKPGDVAIHSRFCHALLEGRLLADSEDCYNEVLKLNAASPEALTHLGEIYFSRKDFKTARNYYERAIGIEPEYAHAWFNLGYLNMKGDKNFEEARRNLNKYLELNEDSPIKNQVKHLILQINDIIGDAPGVPKEGKELIINPEKMLMKIK